jgi:hypothetical protein
MQSVAVTFNALAKLDFASLAVASEDGWSVLVAAAVKCAGTKSGKGKLGFDGQALAMVLNAFANCHAASHELAATKGGWRAFDDNFVAAASCGPQRVVMNMQGACMVLNATWKLIKDHGVSMTPAFRRVAADFASRIADDVPPKTTGLLINSLAKLKGVAAGGSTRRLGTHSAVRAQDVRVRGGRQLRTRSREDAHEHGGERRVHRTLRRRRIRSRTVRRRRAHRDVPIRLRV